MNFLQVNVRLPRVVAVLVTIIFIFSFIIGLIFLFIAELVSAIEYLTKTLPNNVNQLFLYLEEWVVRVLLPFFNDLSSIFNQLSSDSQKNMIVRINELGGKLSSSLIDLLQTILIKIPAILSWFPNAASVFIFTILATFFISKDWYKLKKVARKFVPITIREKGMKIYVDLRKAVFGFFRAQLILVAITALIVLIGLLILRVNYAFAFAFIIGVVDLLPYLGTGIIFVPWIFYELINDNYFLAIGLSVLFIVIVVQRQIMEPKIMSTNLGISPLVSLISIFVGLQIFGFIGLLIGPICAVLAHTLHKANVFHSVWTYIMGKE